MKYIQACCFIGFFPFAGTYLVCLAPTIMFRDSYFVCDGKVEGWISRREGVLSFEPRPKGAFYEFRHQTDLNEIKIKLICNFSS